MGGWEAASGGEVGGVGVSSVAVDVPVYCCNGVFNILPNSSGMYVGGWVNRDVRSVEEVLALISLGNKARYVCVYTTTHTATHTLPHTHTHTHTHTHAHTHTHTQTHILLRNLGTCIDW